MEVTTYPRVLVYDRRGNGLCMTLDNGYSVSVIYGDDFGIYANQTDDTYEVYVRDAKMQPVGGTGNDGIYAYRTRDELVELVSEVSCRGNVTVVKEDV